MTRTSLQFDGTPVPFTPGQTVGAALADAGIVSWRTTRRDHAPRGLFCGIGVCFDCLVTVDGARSQRACLVEACEGQDVRSADPDEPLPLTLSVPAPVPVPGSGSGSVPDSGSGSVPASGSVPDSVEAGAPEDSASHPEDSHG
ncbi:(2Fe-2S)-binding protein [Microbacterium foliorum]|uniref:Hydrogen cyanide synthase subunit HcnA n=1 Tax=Microbacterium foliorum TaxID=104336 RepID=A0A0F0KZ27_9MICO|nr:(2Fe-2S)-binding protein [Microbacterium foliorum]KJL24546.1 Hydrogen cyanide synthase subunit HcnA [Microbacterium foliorum]